MRIIYLLELANSKIFLLVHREPVLDIPRFFLESVIKYDYLKTNKPIRIVDQFAETHPLDLDIFVKKEMLKRGIDNVRGGSYSTHFLDQHVSSLLKKELFHTKKYPDGACSDEVIKEILNTYGDIPTTEVISKREQLKANYEKYQKEKTELKKLKSICIDLYKKQLNWVLQKCQEQITAQKETVLYQILNKEDVQIYRNNFPMFNILYQTFNEICKKPIEHKYKDVLIKNPEFVFDDFMYNGHRSHIPDSIEQVDRIISAYTFFLTYIENRIAELEFDVSSWGENVDLIFPRAIYFLDIFGGYHLH